MFGVEAWKSTVLSWPLASSYDTRSVNDQHQIVGSGQILAGENEASGFTTLGIDLRSRKICPVDKTPRKTTGTVTRFRWHWVSSRSKIASSTSLPMDSYRFWLSSGSVWALNLNGSLLSMETSLSSVQKKTGFLRSTSPPRKQSA